MSQEEKSQMIELSHSMHEIVTEVIDKRNNNHA